ncbi:MAG: PKD domain-containing protein, partial [Bacteroidales bacterium]|nr:PKD domain-containing protein [Bacteroidales bacterium]
FGVTEGGSSGSPLFSNNKLIVGTLTGGSSDCGLPAQNQSDLYGKFDYHWESNGGADNVRLKPWLDPNNTGATILQGREPNAAAQGLAAQFTANPTLVAVGGNVAFTDQSSGGPTSWQWTFEGGNPETSPNPNPTVNYPNAGVYGVTLTVSDGQDEDTEIKAGYITVSDDVPLELSAAFAASAYTIFEGDCVNFQDQSTGSPISWVWNFQGANTPNTTQQNPTNICWDEAGTYNVSLTIENAEGQVDTRNWQACITVEAAPILPIADFSGSPLVVPVGGTVTFTNLCQNGPFEAFAWTFEGGVPAVSNDSVPQPVTYMEVGTYDVELRCKNITGVQDIEKKLDYIKVIPAAIEAPVANFVANYTVIQPGDAVNFIDLSENHPYHWEWIIEGGTPNESFVQNPSNIIFEEEGIYNVCLIVTNNHGTDTLCRENYIVVSEEDPCTDAPVAKFTAHPRLITQGQRVYFQDQSTNLPQNWYWQFPSGTPSSSQEGSITDGVLYTMSGIYNVTLAVSNNCGNDLKTKPEYIYVFSGPVSRYCDTLTNLRPNEGSGRITAPSPYWGYVGGHNGKKVKTYADRFVDYTFGEIKSILVPVEKAVWGTHNSYVRFRIWDGSNDTIGEILGDKKVLLKDLQENFNNVITFDNPVEINGPFYVGYSINYPDADGDGYSDDMFVVSLASPRSPIESSNTLMLFDAGQWKSSVELFGIATSTAIQPIGCIVDIPEYMLEGRLNIYPNPANDIITLEFGEELYGKDVSIQVRNILGNTLLDMPVNSVYNDVVIPISSYPEGMYLVTVIADGKTMTKRVSVMR